MKFMKTENRNQLLRYYLDSPAAPYCMELSFCGTRKEFCTSSMLALWLIPAYPATNVVIPGGRLCSPADSSLWAHVTSAVCLLFYLLHFFFSPEPLLIYPSKLPYLLRETFLQLPNLFNFSSLASTYSTLSFILNLLYTYNIYLLLKII